MPKRKVIIETATDVILTGPNLARGSIRVYIDYPVTAEFKDPKNAGGEIWDWAQSNWDEFTPDEHTFEIGGATVTGERRWCCVIGVMDAKTKKPLPIAETKWKKKKPAKKAKGQTYSKNKSGVIKGDKRKKAQTVAKKQPKPKTKKEQAVDDLVEGADAQADIDAKVLEALGD